MGLKPQVADFLDNQVGFVLGTPQTHWLAVGEPLLP